MAENLELFVIASLHGSLIAAVLIAASMVATVTLLVGFSVGILSAAALDLLSLAPLAEHYLQAAMANLELALVLALCLLMDSLVAFALALKPLFQSVSFEFTAGLRRFRAHIDAFKLN